MTTVPRGLAASSTLLVAVLLLLDATTGLSPAGWAAGLATGAVTTSLVASCDVRLLGPADLVTVSRLSLACAVAALVVDGLVVPAASVVTGPLVAVATLALVLDAVDGQVARHTGTATPFGGTFDGEADAFLLLVLSVHVAATGAWWVLAIGALRYLFLVAGWALPWLRAPLPPRYWRKVVTATQGIVLVAAAASVLPAWLTYAALLLALGMLAESFGRDVVWLWQRRPAADVATVPATLAGAEAQGQPT